MLQSYFLFVIQRRKEFVQRLCIREFQKGSTALKGLQAFFGGFDTANDGNAAQRNLTDRGQHGKLGDHHAVQAVELAGAKENLEFLTAGTMGQTKENGRVAFVAKT